MVKYKGSYNGSYNGSYKYFKPFTMINHLSLWTCKCLLKQASNPASRFPPVKLPSLCSEGIPQVEIRGHSNHNNSSNNNGDPDWDVMKWGSSDPAGARKQAQDVYDAKRRGR